MKEKIIENKTPLIVGVIVLVAILVYVYQNKLANFFLYGGETSTAVGPTHTTASSSSNSSSNNSSTAFTNDTVLKKGDQGDKVGELQVLINKKMVEKDFGYAALTVDKNFGPKTEGALYNLTTKKSISINQFKTYT